MNQLYTEGSDHIDPSPLLINNAHIRNNRKQSQANNYFKQGSAKPLFIKGEQGGIENRSSSNQNHSPSPTGANPLRYTRRNFQKYQQQFEVNNINIPTAPSAQKSPSYELQAVDNINSTSNKQSAQHMQNIASIYTPLSSKAIKRRMLTPNSSQLNRRISSECGKEEMLQGQREGSIVVLKENSVNLQTTSNNPKSIEQYVVNTNILNNYPQKEGNNGIQMNSNGIYTLQSKRNSTNLRKPFIQIQNQSVLSNLPNKSIERYLENFHPDLPSIQTPSTLIQDRKSFQSNVSTPQTHLATPQRKGATIQDKSRQQSNIQKDHNIDFCQSSLVKGGQNRDGSAKQRVEQQFHLQDRTNKHHIKEDQLNCEDRQNSVNIQLNIDDILAIPQIYAPSNKIDSRSQMQEQPKKGDMSYEGKRNVQINQCGGVQSIINNIQNITIKNNQVNYNINTPTPSQRQSQNKYSFQQQTQNNSQNSRSINQSSLVTRANSPFQRGTNFKLKIKPKSIVSNNNGIAKGRISGERTPQNQGTPDTSSNNLHLNTSFKLRNVGGDGAGKKLYIQTQPDCLEEDSREVMRPKRNITVRNQSNNQNTCDQSISKERHQTVHNDSEEIFENSIKQRHSNLSQPRQQVEITKQKGSQMNFLNLEERQQSQKNKDKNESAIVPIDSQQRKDSKVPFMIDETIVKEQNNSKKYQLQSSQQEPKNRQSKKDRYQEEDINPVPQNKKVLEEGEKEKKSIDKVSSAKEDVALENQDKVSTEVKWDLSEEEWNTFGDRFPKKLLKKKLLGRGGFALVWLGEDKDTKESYAVKQIQSRNSHQTHIKEIWFGSFFFKNGQPKEKYLEYRGIYNLCKMMNYDIKPVDTWIYYELCGQSLGSSLYELKSEGYKGEDRVYRVHYKKLYLSMQKSLTSFKKLVFELAHALWLLSDQRIVHSDLKTENILVKTRDSGKGLEIEQVKLIDYGSSFTFGNLKHFSMATPEYMAPEILNFILFQNQLRHLPQLLDYLKNYTKTYAIDIWSLGCVMMEIISGIPLWMSLHTIVTYKGQDLIRQGLFAAKGRVFENIIEKQIDVISKLDLFINEHNYSGIVIDNDLRYLVKRMLTLDPDNRISPKEVCQFLHRSVLGTDFVDISPAQEKEKVEKQQQQQQQQQQ